MQSLHYDAKPERSMSLLLPVLAIALASLTPLAAAQNLTHPPAATERANVIDAVHMPLQVTGFKQDQEIDGAVAADMLEDHRGGSNVSSQSVSNGMLQDTTAVNVTSGVNAITDGAFAHASGLPIVIQNSGSNVLIQNSTIVNVQFK